jgi:hypothetical protein
LEMGRREQGELQLPCQGAREEMCEKIELGYVRED